MEYQVEEISPIKKKVNVTINADKVAQALEKALSAYASDVQIKGFRKGKAPKAMLKSRFKKEIQNEATTELVRLHVDEIMAEIKLEPISPYQFDGQGVEEGQPYTFSYQFEIMPVIDLPDYMSMEVKQAKAEVTDKDIDALIDNMRKSMAKAEDIDEDRPPQDGEAALVSMNTSLDGKEIPSLSGDNFEARLGAGHMLPAIEALVKKTARGRSNEEDIILPEDFRDKKLAGKTVHVKLTAHSVRKLVLPEVDADFAKAAGQFESVEKMRETIEQSFLKSRANIHKAAAQKRLIDALLEKTEFPLPQYMVEERLENNLHEFLDNLKKRGGTWEDLDEKTQEQVKIELTRNANEFVRESLFLQAVAAKEGLEVTPADFNEFFSSTAMRAGRNPRELRSHFEEQNLMSGLRIRLLVGKALELLYDKANVTEVPASELEEKDEDEKNEE